MTADAAAVLIVEDSTPIRVLLSASLRQLGLQVTALAQGEGAVEAACQLRPRLIVLDLMLPDMGGLEILEQLRAREETASIPVLITSARKSPQDRADAELAGADDYLVKPVFPTELAERVRRLLKHPPVRAA